MKISLFERANRPGALVRHLDVLEFLEMVKAGAWAKETAAIRKMAGQPKPKIQKAKLDTLPCVTLSGQYSYRKDAPENLISHSGLIRIDFDGIGDDLENIKSKLAKDPYTFFLFTSVSGRGLGGAVKIPPEKHRESFDALQEYYAQTYNITLAFDKSVKDPARACYVTHDPALFYNEGAKTFVPPKEKPKPKKAIYAKQRTSAIRPPKQRALDTAEKMILSAPDGQKHDTLYNAARLLGGYVAANALTESEAEAYLQEKIEARSATVENMKNAHKTIRDGIQNGLAAPIEAVQPVHLNGGRPAEKIEAEDPELPVFWSFVVNQKTGEVKDVTIHHHELSVFLHNSGFWKHYPKDELNYILIRENNKIIEEVQPPQAADFVRNYLLKYPFLSENEREMVLEKVSRSYHSFFRLNSGIFGMLPELDIKLMEDTKTEAFFFFKNVYLKVSADNIEFLPYHNLPGHIWRQQVKDFHFTKVDENGCDFDLFLKNVSATTDNLIALYCGIGYLLHRYVDVAEKKEVILLDSQLDHDGNRPEGGTGKGIITDAIGQLRNVATVDGKALDQKSQFAFQNVTRQTEVLAIRDVTRKFDDEANFNRVSNEFWVEQKYGQPFKTSAKIMSERNYYPKGKGNSFERRRYIVEIEPFYRKLQQQGNDKPIVAFHGRPFFTPAWPDSEWNRFYTVLIKCVQMYLSVGLYKNVDTNAKLNAFLSNTSQEFYEFCEGGGIETSYYAGQNKYTIQEVYQSFAQEFPEYLKKGWFDEKVLRQWIKDYAFLIGAEYCTKDENGKYLKSGSHRQFYLFLPQEKQV